LALWHSEKTIDGPMEEKNVPQDFWMITVTLNIYHPKFKFK
jgi:hypothetical protein